LVVEGLAARKLLIVYYSAAGNTRKMAEAIGASAQKAGVAVSIRKAEECSLEEMADADGIVVGSPTYFSNVAWQVKKLIDDSIALYRKDHKLGDKVGGCFTSSGTRGDGIDCVRMLELAFGVDHRMMLVPGIVTASGDDDEEVTKLCEQFGAEIARKMLV
jgi:NAD(P)H dehydrogenase (quinone)